MKYGMRTIIAIGVCVYLVSACKTSSSPSNTNDVVRETRHGSKAVTLVVTGSEDRQASLRVCDVAWVSANPESARACPPLFTPVSLSFSQMLRNNAFSIIFNGQTDSVNDVPSVEGHFKDFYRRLESACPGMKSIPIPDDAIAAAIPCLRTFAEKEIDEATAGLKPFFDLPPPRENAPYYEFPAKDKPAYDGFTFRQYYGQDLRNAVYYFELFQKLLPNQHLTIGPGSDEGIAYLRPFMQLTTEVTDSGHQTHVDILNGKRWFAPTDIFSSIDAAVAACRSVGKGFRLADVNDYGAPPDTPAVREKTYESETFRRFQSLYPLKPYAWLIDTKMVLDLLAQNVADPTRKKMIHNSNMVFLASNNRGESCAAWASFRTTKGRPYIYREFVIPCGEVAYTYSSHAVPNALCVRDPE